MIPKPHVANSQGSVANSPGRDHRTFQNSASGTESECRKQLIRIIVPVMTVGDIRKELMRLPMHRTPLRTLGLILAYAFVANSLRAEQNRLFDGKTLDGWDFDEQHWRVEDGEIVGEIPSGQHLSYNTWIIWKGPKLEGTGAKGIEYIVENILNPNAVIGEDFLARQILNLDGRCDDGRCAQGNGLDR